MLRVLELRVQGEKKMQRVNPVPEIIEYFDISRNSFLFEWVMVENMSICIFWNKLSGFVKDVLD